MILMYHNVVPDSAPEGCRLTSITLPFSDFKRQINWLNMFYRIIPLPLYLEEMAAGNLDISRTVALTFDDGTAITFDLVYPFFKEKNIPATIFVSTCQLEGGELIWGGALNAICLENAYDNIEFKGRSFSLKTRSLRKQTREELFTMAVESENPMIFVQELTKSYPVSDATRHYYTGMTHKQLHLAGQSDIVEIGSHSVTHPFLSTLNNSSQYQELFDSKKTLEELTKREVKYFAYPSGDYNKYTIETLKAVGYRAGITVQPKKIDNNILFELPRIGIFSASILRMWLKMMRDRKY